MNRIDRVTAILIQLQSKRVVKAQDIAERFEISHRTVYRDIRALEEAGVPIVGEAGIGYSLMEGYRLPPVMFTKEEATAFLTAEKLVERFTDSIMDESYKSAMYKIRAVLKTNERNFLEHLDQHIEILKYPRIPQIKYEANPLQLILKSIGEKKVLTMSYFANHSQEKTKRNIEPIGIFLFGGAWRLIAYCHLRNDYRDFRVDRILDIRITDNDFNKEHPTLKDYLKRFTANEKELHTVVMSVDKEIIKYFGDQKYYNGFVSEKDLGDKVEMTFLTSSLEGFSRWYMMFGDRAEIITPSALKKTIGHILEKISKKLN